jgi:hypothetical protein
VTKDLLFVDVCVAFDATRDAWTKTDQISLFGDSTKSYM